MTKKKQEAVNGTIVVAAKISTTDYLFLTAIAEKENSSFNAIIKELIQRRIRRYKRTIPKDGIRKHIGMYIRRCKKDGVKPDVQRHRKRATPEPVQLEFTF